MKRTILLLAMAMMLTSCGSADKGTESSPSAAEASYAPEASSVSDEASAAEESEVSEETSSAETADSDDEDAFYAEPDESVNFDSYEAFSSSDELEKALADRDISTDKLSEPSFDEQRFEYEGITMYPECAYYYLTDKDSKKTVSVCLEFRKFDDYAQMCSYLDGLSSDSEGFAMNNGTSKNKEKESYTVSGTHISVFRLSKDGLMYSVFSEGASEEETLAYADDIVL